MPDDLPNAPDATRELAARAKGEGFDTEIARFFGADVASEDEIPTEIDSADLGRTARERASERAGQGRNKVRVR